MQGFIALVLFTGGKLPMCKANLHCLLHVYCYLYNDETLWLVISSSSEELRPVRVAGFVCQVQDVTRHVVLRGEIGQHPRLFGSGDLQPTDRTVPALAAPGDTEKQ